MSSQRDTLPLSYRPGRTEVGRGSAEVVDVVVVEAMFRLDHGCLAAVLERATLDRTLN